MDQGVELRTEGPADIEAIRALNREAFGQDAEADLVDALRAAGDLSISLVALLGDVVVGHIAMSPAKIRHESGDTACLALAPMAVVPRAQAQGIGSRLVEAALERSRDEGHRIVIVLGHPLYYPRFGFEPVGARGIRCPYEAPPEAFMGLGLQHNALAGVRGVVEYAPAFASL
jgi:putative acetyltransferase